MPSSPRQLLIGAEQRFGHLAIGGLLRWIAGFKLLVYVLQFMSPEMVSALLFKQEAIYQGEVWRLFSYIFVPGTRSPLLILFILFFLYFISDGLEQAWGEFRVNVYIISSVICLSAFGMIPFFGEILSIPVGNSKGQIIDGMLTGQVFFASVFLAFASIYPNQIINLLGVIPIKAKWLGFANAGMLVYVVLRFAQGSALFAALAAAAVMAGLFPYYIVFVPTFLRNLKQSSEAAARRSSFEAKMQEATGDSFHSCTGCGKTDTSDPELEFRVSGDGEEYCVECLDSRKNEEAEA